MKNLNKFIPLNFKNLNLFSFLLISIPFILIVLINYGTEINTSVENFISANFFNNTDNSFLKFILSRTVNLSFLIFLPLIITTLFETFRNSYNKNKSFLESSLGRISKSKGYKYADIWYWFFDFIQRKFPILIAFLTFGISSFNSNLSNDLRTFFSSFYDQIFPTSNLFFLIIVTILAILLSEFLSYIKHRIIHEVEFFWNLHEFHHSATEMTIFSQHRVAPAESIIIDTIQVPFAVFLGLVINKSLENGSFIVLSIYMIHMFFQTIYIYYGHSSLKIVYPRPLNLFLQSPACHWLHHSTNEKHFNCNFGGTYTIWDKLFGTFLDESHLKEITEFGVKNTEYNKHHPIYSYTILPILKLIRGFKKIKVV